MSKISRFLKYLDNGPLEKALSAFLVGVTFTAGMSIFVGYQQNNAFLTGPAVDEIFNKFKSHSQVKQALGEPIEIVGAQIQDKVRRNFAVEKMQVSMEVRGKERDGSFLFWIYSKEQENNQKKQWMIKNAVLGIDNLPNQVIKINVNEPIKARLQL